MQKIKCTFVFLLFSSIISYSQHLKLPLWGDIIPNYQETGELESIVSTNIIRYTNVKHPGLEVFLPAKSQRNGQAVIICPGGGYGVLAYDWEGVDIARYLNSKGIVAILLKYRLPHSKSNIVSYKSPLLDAQRAIRLTRANASEWSIDKNKVGVIGFSAGGHLASTLGTHFLEQFAEPTDTIDKLSARPDFMALIYPVITMQDNYTHPGSKKNLLGKHINKEMVDYFSNELQVDSTTPPTFLLHSSDDKAVPVQNSLLFYAALIQNNVPAEMHIYPYGGHGFALAIINGYLQSWTDRLADWLKSME